MRLQDTSVAAIIWAARRERRIALIGLLIVMLAAWGYILAGAGMPKMSTVGDAMSMSVEWSFSRFLLLLVMWWVMMVAMMLPSASPMILLFAAVDERSRERSKSGVSTGFFASGYLVAWGVFSLLAVALQWSFTELALLSPMMASASVPFGAVLLIAAGIYQLTPLKHACLRHCRTPIHFLSMHWRDGPDGAFGMGLEHGAFCLGCCWVLMGLLFYGGVMNLLWIAGLMLYVIIEKLVPAGHWIGGIAGVALIAWGGSLMIAYLTG